MKDERLALVFNFEDAPQELKDTAEKHKENWLRYQKATSQADLWRLERSNSREAYEKTAERFDNLLRKWDPADTKSKDLIEIEDPKEVKKEGE